MLISVLFAMVPAFAAAQQTLSPEPTQTDASLRRSIPGFSESPTSSLPDAPTPGQDLLPDDTVSNRGNWYASSSDKLASISMPATMVAQPAYAASSSLPEAASVISGPNHVELKNCPYDQTHARECRVHWRDLTIGASSYLAFQNIGNLYTGYWYRWETTHGKWFDRWVDSAAGWRWTRWTDGNPFLDDYVGHPMMGAITNYIWIQNDPKGMTLLQSNTREYWKSRLRATAFSAAFSFQWKLGPLGEAGVGHNGDHYFYEDNNSGHVTNETGWVELVTTPVGGLLWNLAEDRLDQSLLPRLESKSRNPLLLISYQFLTPARATGNIFRFRPVWYRDTRQVHATPLFHRNHPEEDEVSETASSTTSLTTPETTLTTRSVPRVRTGQGRFGGDREFGAMIGVSLTNDSFLGSNVDNKYMDMIVRSSSLLVGSERYALRYAPEIIALAMLDEPTNSTTRELTRRRTYGTGLSPEGLQLVFRPSERLQPFLSQNSGFVYFIKPVLTPQGSSLVYDVNFGTGLNIFRTQNQAITFGYRFQHLGPFSGLQRYGTDAHTFFFAISRFSTRPGNRWF